VCRRFRCWPPNVRATAGTYIGQYRTQGPTLACQWQMPSTCFPSSQGFEQVERSSAYVWVLLPAWNYRRRSTLLNTLSNGLNRATSFRPTLTQPLFFLLLYAFVSSTFAANTAIYDGSNVYMINCGTVVVESVFASEYEDGELSKCAGVSASSPFFARSSCCIQTYFFLA